ncbi:MAG TPA: hypothetical protein VFZ49_06490 [Pyrinomonadaceae bacterium]
MTNLIAAIILTIWLAGFGVAQGPSKRGADTTNKIEIAVVEFTPGANVDGMTAEAKRQLQASIAFELAETDRFDVYDVRHTRRTTNASLTAINGEASTAAAVKAGKSLGVRYVVTGMVVEYNTKGSARLKARLVEVATGKVKYSGEISHQASVNSGGAREMQSKVLKPAIAKLTDAITSAI